MTSEGRSHGAITVINAMPCGIGSTIGVGLTTTAVFTPEGDGREVIIGNDSSEDTTMARICIRRAYEHAGIPEPECWNLRTDSDIPVSRGLKSSSTACNAILRAVFADIGVEMDPVDLIRIGVGCAREAKVTVTGSFDDACGAGLGGLVITDNKKDELLHHSDIEDHDVIIYVPKYKIRKTGLPLEALHAVAPEIRKALDIAEDRPFEAMTINGRVISAASGVDNGVAERAMDMGALGAGMSGSGPAVAIVVPKGDGAGFARDLELEEGEIILTSTRCGQ